MLILSLTQNINVTHVLHGDGGQRATRATRDPLDSHHSDLALACDLKVNNARLGHARLAPTAGRQSFI